MFTNEKMFIVLALSNMGA